ncbi:MAG: group 1 glycosyl transferase [Candidatus Berkelbacteria bacterium Licking1014_85]|uniref:Group 1 glycosyl transferase n=1 Tax=Candidatus Berkelbacteria bacterium Licking1014_85 TaxID=2017148 RepID=A0A554LHN3_9BACT|nr:MAG: group 1 glycosyl transferase [Candidatus Berkelbacteria bacterium Licking1014_85]
MTNIIYIASDSAISGGAKVVFDLIENLDKKNFNVFLIAPKGELIEKSRKYCKNIFKISLQKSELFKTTKKIRQIIFEIIKKNQSDKNIVHIHGNKALVFGALAMRKLKISKIYTEHRWTNDFHLKSRFREMVQIRYLRCILKKFDKVIAVSRAVEDFLLERKIVHSGKIQVIYNGVRNISENTSHYSNQEKITIGSLGSLNYVKNYKKLIDIVKNINTEIPFQIKIYGSGPEKDELNEKIIQLNLSDKIQIHDPVQSPYPVLKTFDIFVSTATTESFGLAILEAMSVGLPVIAYNGGALSEIIENEKDGILVENNRIDLFCEKLKELIEYSQKRRILGERAYIKAKQFSIEKFIQNHQGIYNII